MDDIVTKFFSQEFEKQINHKILYYSFAQPEVQVYVESIIAEPIEKFIEFMKSIDLEETLKAEDIFQFSSFEDATDIFCEKVRNIDNPGLTHMQIGKLLQDDGIVRKNGAYVKYGENHAKFAKQLGLAFELCNSYYLSGIGYIYCDLKLEQKRELLIRLILRSNLVMSLYKHSLEGLVDLRQLLLMLADSTYLRRKSNIKKVINFLSNSTEKELLEFIKKIKY